MRTYSTVVLGAGGVGKSALTVRFCRNTFAEAYDPTIEESYRKSLTIDGQLCGIDVLDTAGAEQFTALNEYYMGKNAGFILVFSLIQEISIREVDMIRQQIYRIKGAVPPTGAFPQATPADLTSKVPMVIVGTKSDLVGEREVGRDIMNKLSELWGVPFYETSAKNDWNVTEVFVEIVRQMRIKIPEDEKNRIKKRNPKCLVM